VKDVKDEDGAIHRTLRRMDTDPASPRLRRGKRAQTCTDEHGSAVPAGLEKKATGEEKDRRQEDLRCQT